MWTRGTAERVRQICQLSMQLMHMAFSFNGARGRSGGRRDGVAGRLLGLGGFGVEDGFEVESGEGFDSAEEFPQGKHGHGHGRHDDDGPAPEVHFAEFLVERGGARRAREEVACEGEIENGAEKEAAGEQEGAADEQGLEVGFLAVCHEGVVYLFNVDHLLVVEQFADEGAFGAHRDEDHDSNDGRDGGLLAGEPEAVEFHQAEAAGEEDAGEADDGNEVGLAPPDEVIDSVADGKREGEQEAVDGSEAGFLAQLGKDEAGQQDVADDIDEEVLALGCGGRGSVGRSGHLVFATKSCRALTLVKPALT